MMDITRILLLAGLSFFVSLGAKAQVSGILTNGSGKPVQNISVLLKHNNGQVIGYDYTNAYGRFTLTVPDTVGRSRLFIEVNWLGYRKVQHPLKADINEYPIVLEESVVELKEVKVKAQPMIRQMGDTLRFDVNSFSRKEDRNIGDVIGRLPGMQVEENGKISFNGKDIDNLLVGGDDLMDGRYGMATRTITKDMIKSIDVMMNHQPIRVLKNKIFSDKVVVNLVLKDEYSTRLGGQVSLGLGIPGRYEGELNGIVLNRTFKMLNSIKANNTGTDYQADFMQLGNTTDLNHVDISKPNTLLSEGIAGSPDLPRKNYYLNQSLAFNFNNLLNTGDTLQLRTNLQLFFDKSRFHYTNRSEYYLPADTIRYYSVQQSLRKPFLLNTSFTAMVNKSRYYLNNQLRMNVSGFRSSSELDFNGRAFGQVLDVKTWDVSNDLQYTPALKGRSIGNLRWYTNFYSQPQRLTIGAGIDSAVLNASASYADVGQQVSVPSFFNHVSVYYTPGGNPLIKQVYHAGMLNEWQQLVSAIGLTQWNGTSTVYKGDPGNALQWRRNRWYADGVFSFERKNWRADLTLPLSLQGIHYYDEGYGQDERRNYVFVNPHISARFFLNPEDYITVSGEYRNTTGGIVNVYRGLMLTNYLSLVANDASLQEKAAQTWSLQYYLRRNISMFFVNAGISYNETTVNSILSSEITDQVQRVVLLPYENRQNNLNATLGLSKYVFGWRTTLSTRAAWKLSRYNQFVNGAAFPFRNENVSLNINVQSKPFTNITLNYNGTGNWNVSRSLDRSQDERVVNRVKRFDQLLLLGYTKGSLFVNTTGRHIYGAREGMDNINYLFLDANLRYRVARWRMDLELGVVNLFNLREYKTASIMANQYVFSSYEIRGRMAVLKTTFNL